MKNKRQQMILKIISENDIETQEELLLNLKKCGVDVTQATVSRDVKKLGLIKSATKNHKYKYSVIETADRVVANKHSNIFKEAVLSIKHSSNIIVVKTVIGSANSACAFIDALDNKNILGSIAGDDTIFIVTEIESVNEIKELLNKCLYE